MKLLITIFFALMLPFSAIAGPKKSEKTTAPVSEEVSQKREPSQASDYNRFAIRLSPLWMIFKEVNVDFQYKLTPHLSIGPILAVMNGETQIHAKGMLTERLFFEDKMNRIKYGIRATYFLNAGNRRSTYFSVLLTQSNSEVTASSGSFFSSDPVRTGEFSETKSSFAAGYQWYIKDFLVLHVGGTIDLYSSPDSFVLKSSDNLDNQEITLTGDGSGVFIDAGVGYTF